MTGRQILFDQISGCEAAALLVGGQLEDILLDAPDRPRPGAIHMAICDRPMGGQGGMMVRLATGMGSTGMGYLRQAKGLRPGAALPVQIAGFSEGRKAVPVTRKLTFKTRLCVVTPTAPGWNISRQITDETLRASLRSVAEGVANPDWGLILRSSAAEADPSALAQDIATLTDEATRVMSAPSDGPLALTPGDTPRAIALRDWDGVASSDGFSETGVLDALDTLRSPLVSLGSGSGSGSGSMSLEPTRALVAVDIDTGGDTSHSAGLKANLSAMSALPRALRLRGLSGQIVVDLAPMPKGQRPQLEAALRRALASDPVDTTLAGWSALGHLELQRKRDRLPLVARLPSDL